MNLFHPIISYYFDIIRPSNCQSCSDYFQYFVLLPPQQNVRLHANILSVSALASNLVGLSLRLSSFLSTSRQPCACCPNFTLLLINHARLQHEFSPFIMLHLFNHDFGGGRGGGQKVMICLMLIVFSHLPHNLAFGHRRESRDSLGQPAIFSFAYASRYLVHHFHLLRCLFLWC